MEKHTPGLAVLIMTALLFCQSDTVPAYKYSLGITYLSFLNFGDEATNTHHYEFHAGYQLSAKNKISLKLATWKLFAPMGIPLWDTLFLDKREFFPGRIHESGIGITYQRILWKGLFATIEILPLLKRYLNTDNQEIGKGFKLYTTYHIGYHITILKNRFFIEPQIHGNYWPIDTKAPQSFEEKEKKWNNFFILEPNLYLGIIF